MTVVLLCGAALLVRTVIALTSVNHGFEQQGLLTMQVSLPGTRYPIERQVAFQQELLTTIRELPGVDSAAPQRPAGDWRSAGRHVVSSALDTGRAAAADAERDDPGRHAGIFPDAAYSSAARTRVYARRRCESDAGIHRQPGVRRSISSERGPACASRSWCGCGTRILTRRLLASSATSAKDRCAATPRPTIFYSHSQLPLGPTLFVRTDRPAATAEAVTSVIRRMDPNLRHQKRPDVRGSALRKASRRNG